MLSRTLLRSSFAAKKGLTNPVNMRVFSSGANVGLGDAQDLFKVNYTEEFDQGLTED
jgi:hypothetical protein